MSLFGTIAGAAVSSFFGARGSSGSSAGFNPARSFSAMCGISPPVSEATKIQAKRMGGDPCANALRIASGRGVLSIPQPVPRQPIPVFGPGQVIGGVLGGVAGAVSGTAQASPFGLAGVVLSAAMRRKAVAFAKNFGIQLAATVFGISLLDMANIVANPPKRRRRGITAAQLANARRVNCKIQTMARSLGMSCTGRKTPVRRKTSCR